MADCNCDNDSPQYWSSTSNKDGCKPWQRLTYVTAGSVRLPGISFTRVTIILSLHQWRPQLEMWLNQVLYTEEGRDRWFHWRCYYSPCTAHQWCHGTDSGVSLCTYVGQLLHHVKHQHYFIDAISTVRSVSEFMCRGASRQRNVFEKVISSWSLWNGKVRELSGSCITPDSLQDCDSSVILSVCLCISCRGLTLDGSKVIAWDTLPIGYWA